MTATAVGRHSRASIGVAAALMLNKRFLTPAPAGSSFGTLDLWSTFDVRRW